MEIGLVMYAEIKMHVIANTIIAVLRLSVNRKTPLGKTVNGARRWIRLPGGLSLLH